MLVKQAIGGITKRVGVDYRTDAVAPRLLLVGLSTRVLAESARRAGYSFFTLDYFGDYDQRQICRNVSLMRDLGKPYSAQALLEAGLSLRSEYDALAYTSSLENHPEIVARLSRGKELLGNGPATLRRVRNPAEVFSFLAGRGFAVPRAVFCGEPLPRSGRWLDKPLRGGGGSGIRWWDGKKGPGERRMLQEFIEGRSASFSFAANGHGCVAIGWSEQLVGDGDFGSGGFVYTGNIVPLDAPLSLWEEAQAIAGALTAEFGLRGLNGFDFILRDGRPYVLEVNPRHSASMELMDGVNTFEAHVEACRGHALPQVDCRAGPAHGFRGKAILYAPRNVEVGDTRGWMQRGIRDVPHPGETIQKDHPICTLLADGPSRDDCHRALSARADGLRREMYG